MAAPIETSKSIRRITNIIHVVVLILSLVLIVYISYDTFEGINFLENHFYMKLQLWICVAFMADFVIELIITQDKRRYFKTHVLFFFVSVPVLNIIHYMHYEFSAEQLYFLRFIPLIRGAYALSIVVGYISNNRISSMLASYLAILLSLIYFSSLIFYQEEFPANVMVKDYGDALWWAFMNVTTIGCDINPTMPITKILAVTLAGAGMMMFPLFTVYITNIVQRYNEQHSK